MNARLIDFMDPNRPLAKAALDLDWTTVVALFPEANLDGYDAPRIWVLASILILGEISGLSENEVLSRWPENPYWQAFSGFAQFQWKAPVTQADCLTFRRYVDAPRAARLSTIAQSILQARPLEPTALEAVPLASGPSIGEALALRQLHFLQPQPPQPYKAPVRAGLQNGIKQAYAKAAAPTQTPPAAAQDPGATAEANAASGPEPTGAAQTSSNEHAPTSTTAAVPLEQTPPAAIPEKPVVPQFAQTYTLLVKKAVPTAVRPQSSGIDGLASPEPQISNLQVAAPSDSTQPPIAQPLVAPLNAPGPELSPTVSRTPGAGVPQFDTTAPFMRKALPDEPVTMEVVVTGDAPMRFQWETFDNAQGAATPIAGCNEPTLTVALEAGDAMLAFQCRVSNSACPQGVVSRTFFLKKAPIPPPPVETRPIQPVKPAPARKAR
jgi:IS5 family transposase